MLVFSRGAPLIRATPYIIPRQLGVAIAPTPPGAFIPPLTALHTSPTSMDIGGALGGLAARVVGALQGVAAGEAERTCDRNQSFAFGSRGVTTVDLDSASGNVSFVGQDGNEELRVMAHTRVRGNTHAEADAFIPQVAVHADVDGSCLRVRENHPPPPHGVNVSVDFEVTGPRHMALVLKASNGNAVVTGCDAPHARVESNNGNVSLDGACGKVQLRTQNGGVLAKVRKLLQGGSFTTTNGNVDVHIVSGTSAVEAKSNNGNVDVHLAGSFAGHLHASSSNGQVRPCACTHWLQACLLATTDCLNDFCDDLSSP